MRKTILAPLLVLLLVAGCRSSECTSKLPRGKVSAEWASAVEDFYREAVSVQAPDKAQPHSIMVLKKGKVIYEEYFAGYAPDSVHQVYSVSKTVLALAAGFAVEEGKIGVDDKVTDYFPGRLPENISDTLSSMTVRHLLTMTCGMEETAKLLSAFKGDTSFSYLEEFFASRQAHMPGTEFYYNFFAPYILAAIIQKQVGMSIMDYIRPRLLEPLKITDMQWETSHEGICVGGWGMLLCTEDMAKLGQLLLQRGRWNGRQLISPQWMDTMTSKLVESMPVNAFARISDPAQLTDPANDHTYGYGYYVWQGKGHTYRMEGILGQLVIVSPDKDLVLAMTGMSNMDQRYLDIIWKHFSHLLVK